MSARNNSAAAMMSGPSSSKPPQRVLSSRQQHILTLICDGYNVADIASELAMSPERVSDEKYKAIQKLRTYFKVEMAS